MLHEVIKAINRDPASINITVNQHEPLMNHNPNLAIRHCWSIAVDTSLLQGRKDRTALASASLEGHSEVSTQKKECP